MEDFIGVYDDVFDQKQCDEIIDSIEHFDHRKLLFHNDESLHHMDHKTINLSMHYQFPAWSLFGELYLPTLKPVIDNYLKRFSVLDSKNFIFYDVKLKKIVPGAGFHNWHFENGGIMQAARLLVVQTYFNTIDEGGETEFLYLNKRIKAKRGRTIIFPTAYTHTHRGNSPIGEGNIKYIGTTWGWIQDAQ